MKILFLSQGEKISDHPGWEDALLQLKKEGEITDYLNIPFFGYGKEHGWDSLYNDIVSICEKGTFNVVYFHYFHGYGMPSPKKCIEDLRKLSNAPVIITSAGDPFSDNLLRPDYPSDFKEASRMADITFSTQMGLAADKMIKWGARNIVYTPNSMCQVRFNANSVDVDQHQFDFDVVFIGNNNGSRLFNPISQHWWRSRERVRLVNALYKQFGNKFGLFGHGWNLPCAQGSVLFNDQQNTFRRGRVLVGGNPYSTSDYYSSNRIFFEISSGIPTVELAVPRLANILRNKDHCYFAYNIDEVIEYCEVLLKEDPNVLYGKAAAAAKYIEEKHTQYHRMKFKLDTVRRFIKNGHKLDVDFPFFLPEINIEEEKYFAIRQQL